MTDMHGVAPRRGMDLGQARARQVSGTESLKGEGVAYRSVQDSLERGATCQANSSGSSGRGTSRIKHRQETVALGQEGFVHTQVPRDSNVLVPPVTGAFCGCGTSTPDFCLFCLPARRKETACTSVSPR